MRRPGWFFLSFALTAWPGSPGQAQDFLSNPAGRLIANSGLGAEDPTVYAPGMRFPVETGPAFANSQVYGIGGSQGEAGSGQCDPRNYAYPWRDNFCEARSHSTPACPNGSGHQGQDIRPATCSKDKYWAVAAEEGRITGIGRYTVTLLGDSGTQYRYMHLNMERLAVQQGKRVGRGERIGLISNYFGGTPTTIHLHFEMRQLVQDVDGNRALTFVPPYMSLVRAYETLLVKRKTD